MNAAFVDEVTPGDILSDPDVVGGQVAGSFANMVQTTQQINEALVNLPDEYVINGKTVMIASKSIRERIEIDRAIVAFQVSQMSPAPKEIGDGGETEEAYEKLGNYFADKMEKQWQELAKIVALILRDKKLPDDQQITIDDVMDMDASDESDLNKIIQRYVYRNNPENFVKNVMGARSF